MNFNTPLITITDLKENLNDPKLILLDCTIDKVGQSIKNEHLELIPNSKFFDLEHRFSKQNSDLPHTLVSEKQFSREAQLLGINQDDIIVCYDRWGVYSSPRAWWMFKVMGYENVYVLNGGIKAWKNANLPVKSYYSIPENLGTFEAKFQENWYANSDDILNTISDSTIQVIDARSTARYNAEVDEPRIGLRKGHIPHSKNLPFELVLNEAYIIESNQLHSLLDPLIFDKKSVIYSCGSGITASILALVNKVIKPELEVKVYDGSWAEWGKEEQFPIES